MIVVKHSRSFRLLCVGAAVLAAAVAATLGVSAPASATAPISGPAAFAKFRGIVHAHGVAPVAAAPTPQLTYHGGPVMRTNTVYAIYWSPDQTKYPYGSGYQSTINAFFQNVAADNGKATNVYASDTQYSDTTGPIQYQSTFGGSFLDADAYPTTSGCSDSPYASKCLTDQQIQKELAAFLPAHNLPINRTTMYFVFTPKNVGSCFSIYCSFKYYCAYHSNGDGQNANTNILYANMPYADMVPSACGAPSHPNGNDADSTINVTSHEHNEAITDPLGSAWYRTSDGSEDGDLCAWNFGTQLGNTAFGAYNQAIGSGKYELQGEYSNSDVGCVWSEAPPPPPSPPSISGFSPASGPGGSTVVITGSNFTGANGVTLNGESVQFTIKSDTEIDAVVPCDATDGPIRVSNSNGSDTTANSFDVTTPGTPSITSFTPGSGTVGTSVTITGTALACATANGVQFNGTPATITSNSDTQIKANVPTGASTGPITVTTAGGTSAPSSTSFTVVTAPPPVITSFTPGYGIHGAQVTINGQNFTGALNVTLRGTTAAFTVSSSTKIVATVPTIPRGFGRWAVTTPSGSATSSGSFYVSG